MIDPQKYPDVLYCHTDLHDSEVEFELPTSLGEGTGLIENGGALSRLYRNRRVMKSQESNCALKVRET